MNFEFISDLIKTRNKLSFSFVESSFALRCMPVLCLCLLCFSCKPKAILQEIPKPKSAPTSSNLPREFIESLRQDAAYILINEIKLGTEGPVEFADLPPALIDKYQRMLIRVHEFVLQQKEVPSLREVHQFNYIDLKKIQVVLKPNCSFLENWINGLTTTDNLYLNKIIAQYQIKVTNYQKNAPGYSFDHCPIPDQGDQLSKEYPGAFFSSRLS